ncbi:MAG: ABC transporter permease [Propionicimonas sp.]|uniref:ABC transporter permease n=1 Tax=Propionicimonas sp. TaxID=1955623 RepID=UPI002B212FBE|nr:ABC transporter permease [Propionicimonas sp.]MEA4944284.1 ABC transporter permease [Propionicimonas sp.]MEA5116285.1 ABC transporter permease [Propionicimonas sp.]
MLRYIGRRFLNYLFLLFVAVSLTYVLAATQLNPRALYELRQPPVAPDIIESQLLKYNLSDSVPLAERYWIWLTGVLHGDWGYSPLGVSVGEQISTRMWVSLRLLLIGTILGIVLGVAFGAWTATRQYKVSDRVVTFVSLLIISTPAFVVGHVTQILATWYNDITGTRTFEFIGETGDVGDYPFAELVDRLQHLFLPTLVLIILGAASMSRIQRNLMLDSLGADYVRTARAKGLTRRKAVFKHALRTALIPTGTYFAFSVATMFTGATFTERIFNFPGLGQYGVDTITNRDVNGTVAVTAFAGVCVLVGAVLSDIMVAILDPRVRLG